MKKITILLLCFTIASLHLYAQKNSTPGPTSKELCDCSKLEVFPFFYYSNPLDPSTSYYKLRFDFNHKGNKCLPVFNQSITIKSGSNTVTIPVGRLTTDQNNERQRIFTVLPSQIPFRLIPERTVCTISYSLSYGVKACLAKSVTVKFKKEAPLL